MTIEQIWKGKGPIMYEVSIHGSDKPSFSPIVTGEVGWNYTVIIRGAGAYKNTYLGNDAQDFVFLADTKDGVARTLAAYILNQAPLDKEMRKFRKESEMPPQLLALNNVEIFDNTDNNGFHDMDVPGIFANANALYDSPAPPGERPFIVTIRDNEEFPKHYDIYMGTMDPVVLEELENYTAYEHDLDDYHDAVPAQDVNKTIKDGLSGRHLEEGSNKISPNVNNTKLINYTDNPEFTLNRIFNTVKPLRIMYIHPSAKIRQTRIGIPIAPIVEKEMVPLNTVDIEKELQTEKEKHMEDNKQRKRLRA